MLTPVLADVNTEKLLLVGLIVGAVIVVYAIYSIRKVMDTQARERTKREIAAYVSEGTLTAADGAKLLSSGTDEAERMIADGVAWGTVKPEKAEKLIRAMRERPSGEALPTQA